MENNKQIFEIIYLLLSAIEMPLEARYYVAFGNVAQSKGDQYATWAWAFQVQARQRLLDPRFGNLNAITHHLTTW